nr:hypothetical protein [Tanacetum cinerariifolium]
GRERGGESEEEKETSEEEEVSFDPIPRTPEDSEKESDDEEEQESRLSEEARIREEEDAEELYRDGRGLQASLEVEESYVTLTPVNPDAMQTNQFAGAVSVIPRIVNQYMDQRMNEAVKVAIQIQSDRLRDEAQRENEEFLKTVDENM